MAIVSQVAENEKMETEGSVAAFFREFQIGKLLKKCLAEKQKGCSALSVFMYIFCQLFSDRSMYMQLKLKRWAEDFQKDTVYRFLSHGRTNWERFTSELSAKVVEKLRPLTDETRKDVFIIDDSLYERAGFKKTELAARVFDHVGMRYTRGYRMLTLGWSDGNSFVPISHRLLGSSKAENQLGPMKETDLRSNAGKRRKQAVSKATEVMISLVKSAQESGHRAKYVLFDSWFSSPKCLMDMKTNCSMDSIAMVKKSSKIRYRYSGELKNIKQIFASCRKRPGRSRYLLSVTVDIVVKDGETEHSMPAKIVCVRNRNDRKDWLAILSTDTTLSEDEIIRIYGKRWDIEVFFKVCKSMLKLRTECHSLSYDSLTAHVSIVFARYMLLSLQQRRNTDERSLGELLLLITDELADITFSHALQLIVDVLLTSVSELFHLTADQLAQLTETFFSKLPTAYQHLLRPQTAA